MQRKCPTTIALAFAALAGASPGAGAATVCVTSGIDLQQILATAGTNSEADDIRIAGGGFAAQPLSGGVRWRYQSTQDFALQLSGGWAPGCMGPHPQGMRTVLTGQAASRVLEIVVGGGQPNVVVRDLDLFGGRSTTTTQGSGMRIATTTGYGGNVTIERIRVTGSSETMTDSAAFRVDASGGVVTIRNSLFADNVSGVALHMAALSGASLRFNNNTVVDQRSLLDEASQLLAFNGGTLRVSNNVFARNLGAGPVYDEAFGFAQTGSIELRSNHFEQGIAGTYALNVGGSIGDARLASVGLPVPAPNSPVRNSGFASPDGGFSTEDLARSTRVQGVRVDKGALEFPEIFSDGFE